MTKLPRIVLKPRRARPFFARHPWVFAGSIDRVEGHAEPGDEVSVVSFEDQFIARGLFNPRSAIQARLYRWEDEPLDDAFWKDRIETALRLRSDGLGLSGPGTAARLIFSESDGLSGLTVDRYDRWLVVQFGATALALRREFLIATLVELTGAEGVILRTDRSVARQEGLELPEGPVLGSLPPEPIGIVENEIRYLVDLTTGQKTGFYLDQRENRRAIAGYCRGKRVLDLYCYTGGFALNALKHGGASWALGVDSSATAVEIARRNAVGNGLGSVRFDAAQVVDAIETLTAAGDRFGVVVCDPPKFARNPKGLEDAIRAYLRLNRAAVGLLEPDGVLVTCSCSSAVDRGLFADVLGQTAELSGRTIQILEQRGQAPDHPVSASCLETDYLKCFICRVV